MAKAVSERPELFHSISDPDSARVRRWVADRGLAESGVQFRNVAYAEAQADLSARGGHSTPALWDGSKLWTKVDEIIGQLGALLG